jgi:hypothetical protein
LSVRHWAICVCVAEPDPGQFVTRRRPGVSVAAAFVRPPDVLTMVSPAADSASAAGGRRVGPPSSRQCRETPEPFVPTDRKRLYRQSGALHAPHPLVPQSGAPPTPLSSAAYASAGFVFSILTTPDVRPLDSSPLPWIGRNRPALDRLPSAIGT